MFGSPTKDAERSLSSPTTLSSPNAPTKVASPTTTDSDPSSPLIDKRHSTSTSSTGRNSTDEAPGSPSTPKRRQSSVAKASAFLASAKQSLHLSHAPQNNSEPVLSAQQTAMQKLGKTDPALSVPQGSHNNSAGESHPGPRSTFRVGVTEDKNKKCRRTMEDTHAYLYNFLSTPKPVLSTPDADSAKASAERTSTSSEKKERNDAASPASPLSEVMETDNGYFAIFDGHAGTFAADWCGKKLHLLLEDVIRTNPNSAIPELLDQTFTSVDRELQTLPLKNSGCTAICAVLRWEDRIPNPQSATGSTAIAPIAAAVVKAQETPVENDQLTPFIPNTVASISTSVTASTALPKLQEAASRQRVLYTANVGDARIVLCRNGKALRLSYDHKGSDENEGRRITNAGGLILNNRVNGVLAVTRALGDAYMKDLVTGHPYTTETVIQPDVDEFLILACDGLWDVCSDQDAVDLIRHTQDPQAASKQLVDHALSRFSTDNLSCMVVRFDNEALKRAVETTSDRIGVEGDPGGQKGHLSEAEAHVQEARRSLSIPDNTNMHEEITKVSQDIIKEEEEAEAGPEVEADGVKRLAEANKERIEELREQARAEILEERAAGNTRATPSHNEDGVHGEDQQAAPELSPKTSPTS